MFDESKDSDWCNKSEANHGSDDFVDLLMCSFVDDCGDAAHELRIYTKEEEWKTTPSEITVGRDMWNSAATLLPPHTWMGDETGPHLVDAHFPNLTDYVKMYRKPRSLVSWPTLSRSGKVGIGSNANVKFCPHYASHLFPHHGILSRNLHVEGGHLDVQVCNYHGCNPCLRLPGLLSNN